MKRLFYLKAKTASVASLPRPCLIIKVILNALLVVVVVPWLVDLVFCIFFKEPRWERAGRTISAWV